VAYTEYYDASGVLPTYAEYQADLEALLELNTSWEHNIIGKSCGNRGIDEIIVSHGDDDTQTLFIDGGIHNYFEVLSVSCAVGLLHYISLNPSSFPTTKLVVLPNVNPDAHSTQEGPKTLNGVNINRNFPTGWAAGGFYFAPEGYSPYGFGDPDHGLYYGPSPASEPETQAIIYSMKKAKPNKYFNIHEGADALNHTSALDNSSVDAINSFLVANDFVALTNTVSDVTSGKARDYGHFMGALSFSYSVTLVLA